MTNYLYIISEYDAWANGELFLSVAGDIAAESRVAKLLGHHVAAKRVWLARVFGEDTFDWDLWPVYALAEADHLLREADGVLLALCREDGGDFGREIEYRNQTGKYFKTKLSDIIIHLVNHATYHRGQLATAVKAAGGDPAASDYIAWVRAGWPTRASWRAAGGAAGLE